MTSVNELPNLKEQLDAKIEEMTGEIPADKRAVMNQKTEALEMSGLAVKSTGLEHQFPEFELPNATGETVKLSELLEKGPLVISFYRGGWCPYCNLELKALQNSLWAIREQGGDLVAISPEMPDHSVTTKEKNDLEFEVLTDQSNELAKQLGIVHQIDEELNGIYQELGINIEEYNQDGKNELPLPAIYVIDTDRVIRWAFVRADYRNRAEPAEVIEALKQIS
ncbi:MAG: AhpC/TSA family protein [Planctomycetaceae bacterium]|nr:AhpC/TSA family protein [Planctomycetaceae bacterium]